MFQADKIRPTERARPNWLIEIMSEPDKMKRLRDKYVARVAALEREIEELRRRIRLIEVVEYEAEHLPDNYSRKPAIIQLWDTKGHP